MDEHNADGFHQTFQGVDTKLLFSALDARTQELFAGGAAGEKFEIDSKTGVAVIGAKSGKMFQKTFKNVKKSRSYIQAYRRANAQGAKKLAEQFDLDLENLSDEDARQMAALIEIANTYAVGLKGNSGIAAALVGSQTGVDFDSAVQGKFRVIMGDGKISRKIENEVEFLEWVKMMRSNTQMSLNDKVIRTEFENKREAYRRGSNKPKRAKEEEEDYLS
jgi:hypothetical protein